MLAPGIALFTFGYALLWTGVQRFRGKDTTLIDALGYSGGSTTKVTDKGAETTDKDVTKAAADAASGAASSVASGGKKTAPVKSSNTAAIAERNIGF